MMVYTHMWQLCCGAVTQRCSDMLIPILKQSVVADSPGRLLCHSDSSVSDWSALHGQHGNHVFLASCSYISRCLACCVVVPKAIPGSLLPSILPFPLFQPGYPGPACPPGTETGRTTHCHSRLLKMPPKVWQGLDRQACAAVCSPWQLWTKLMCCLESDAGHGIPDCVCNRHG